MQSLAAALTRAALASLAACAAIGCGDAHAGGSSDSPAHDAGGDALRPRPDRNIPPTGADALTSWLAARYYDDWACEAGAHYALSAPHGRVRVCNNAAIVDGPSDGDYHVGAASVKELLDARGDVIGHALALRGRPDAGAVGWYFYAQVQPGAAAAFGDPSSTTGLLADGWGDAQGNARDVCAQCHAGAPRDFVFTDLGDP